MTRRRSSAGPRFLKGVSLIELMISVVIGLIIISAVFSAYLGAAGASRMAEAQGRMDEDAQAALTILTQQLRLAGVNPEQNWTNSLNYSTDTSIYNPVYQPAPSYATANPNAQYITPKYVNPSGPAFALSAYTLRGCEGSFENVTTAYNLDALTCVTDTTVPNSFGVNYEADVYNTIPASTASASAPSAPTDCLGNVLSEIDAKIPQPAPATSSAASSSSSSGPASSSSAAPAPASTAAATYHDAYYYEADNRFYIKQSQQTQTPSLYCQGNGIGAVEQPLVQNVEDMQITYGVQAPDGVSSTVAGYLQADQLLAQADLNPVGTEAGRWKKVVTVRICLQMRSATRVVATIASASYLKCDGTLDTTKTDLLLRRTYTTTVVLRNKLL